MNNSIEQVFQKFQDEFGIKPDGQVNASVRGTARLADIEPSSLYRGLESADAQKSSKLSKFLANNGIEPVAQKQFLQDGIPDIAVALILEYYAYETQPRYQKEQAKLVCRAFRAIGFRQWVKQQKGIDEQNTHHADQHDVNRVPPKRDSIDFINAADKLSNLEVNGQLKQLLEDALVDDLAVNNTNQTALTAAQKEYTIVKVRAKELGYSIEQINSGTGLGKYIANRLQHAFTKRVGDYEVKHYEVTDELDQLIHDYFSQKVKS